jgi:hypothetical protein
MGYNLLTNYFYRVTILFERSCLIVPSTKNRVVVLLPDDILESMKLQAQKENRSMSNMILIALKNYLEKAAK